MAQKIATATFSRPADTNAYIAGDVIGPITTPAVMDLSAIAGNPYIVSARLHKESATVANAGMRLHLWSGSAGPTAIADNLPLTTLWADRALYIGYIDFTPVTAGSGSTAAFAQANNVNLPLVSTQTAAGVFGVLEALAGYVPVSGEDFLVMLVSDNRV